MQSQKSPQAKSSRLLIIRFSSFGDIVQALSAPRAFRNHFPEASVDWLVRRDFQGLLIGNPSLNRVHSFDRQDNLLKLIRVSWSLSKESYTHIYDAHSNLRSLIVRSVFFLRDLTQLKLLSRNRVRMITRPKSRVRRFLYFKLGLKTLPEPFKGSASFLWPLAPWGVSLEMPPAPLFKTSVQLPGSISAELQALSEPRQALPNDLVRRVRVALVASAAWEMKRWPIAHFKRLIELWPEADFVLLGGPEDKFLAEIAAVAPERTLNLAGKLSLAESSELVNQMDLIIANDTGLMHVADQLGRPTLALIGPSAFGYPSHRHSRVSELTLSCKPCSKDGRGRCKNSIYKRCLVELMPETVLANAKDLLNKTRVDKKT